MQYIILFGLRNDAVIVEVHHLDGSCLNNSTFTYWPFVKTGVNLRVVQCIVH